MELLESKFISCVTLLDVRLSEGEVTVLADCLNFMLKHCTDEQIDQETECENREELSWYRNSLFELLKSIEHREYLPERYKNL